MSEKTEDKISIYKLDTPEEILDYYKNWSSNNNYEKDLEEWNYVAPHECCQLFINQVQNKYCFLDFLEWILKFRLLYQK